MSASTARASSVLNPTYEGDVSADVHVAPPIAELAGLKIGLLTNGKRNADRLLEYMADELRAEYGVADVVRARKAVFSAPCPPELMESLLGCDALLTAIGD